jgi:hypothetical protein
MMRSPVEAVITTCSFLIYWSGLLTGIDKKILEDGAQQLMNMADDMSNRSAASGDHFPAMLGELAGAFPVSNFFCGESGLGRKMLMVLEFSFSFLL